MAIREEPVVVPPALSRWVSGISVLRAPPRGETVARLPDAATSLVVCEDAEGARKVVVVGPIRRAFYKAATSLSRYTRIKLHHGVARVALGVSPRELTDGAVDLLALGRRVRPWVDALTARTDSLDLPTLLPCLEGAPSPGGYLARRAATILSAECVRPPRMGVLAARLHVSERFLRDAFRDEVGLPPKRYARIERIRKVAHTAMTEPTPLATLAMDHGFFDQAHLNAEFRDLLRATPTAYRRGDVPRSSACSTP